MYDFLAEKTIVIYTEVIFGSGDFLAAKKLIRLIEKEATDVTIHWIISAPKERVDVTEKMQQALLEFSKNTHVMQRDWNESLKIDHITHCDLVLLYPTTHYLRLHDFKSIKAFNVPVVQLHEYDSIPSNFNPVYKSELVCVNTGFDGLGLNFEDLSSITAKPLLDTLLPAPWQLNPDSELFFSYVNTNTSAQINQASFINYLSIALELSNPEKNIEIVANTNISLYIPEISDIVWSQGISEIVIIAKNKEGDWQEKITKRPSYQHNSGRRLRFIDPFPISNPQMLALMSAAHPFIQTTGDQSLAQTLSVSSLHKGVFPFYQMMYWKVGLHPNWRTLANAYLGNKSAYVKLLDMVANEKDFVVNDFVDIWRKRETQILADSLKFFTMIKEERNLNANHLTFLDFIFYIVKNFPSNEFATYCQLLAQLIVKIKDAASIKRILSTFSSTPDFLARKSLMHALTKFLCLNPYTLTENQLHDISNQLRTIKTSDQLFAATMVKDTLCAIPSSVRERYLLHILPELQRVSAGVYALILEEVKNTKHIARQKDREWFKNIVTSNIIWNTHSTTNQLKYNRILICVTVYPDGLGDLAKFIDTYHITKRTSPGVYIEALVYCVDTMRSTVLHLLRAAKVDMHRLSLCTFTNLEFIAIQYAGESSLAKQLTTKKHNEVNFSSHRKYLLYISVATPFPDINHNFRKHSRVDTHYLDVGEVNFVSYTWQDRQVQDPNHHLVSMGLDDESVGLQITEPSSYTTPDQIFANLDDKLRNKLLDGKRFTEDCALFPFYVKHDDGILSIHYVLGLMRTYFKNKSTAILWMSNITFNLDSQLIQQKLRNDGFQRVVYYNLNGRREEKIIDAAVGDRELRIVTGTVNTKDFDLLYQLAGLTTGFAGCSGQNSFEKTLSFNLVPSFCAPAWQMPIISQTQQIIATIFDHQSQEYLLLNRYFDLLAHVSTATKQIKSIRETPLLKPFESHLNDLTHTEMLAALEVITDGALNAEKIGEVFPNLLNGDSFALVDDFFNTADLELLRNSWNKVCNFCRQYHNLNTWLTNQLQKLIPDPSNLLITDEDSAHKATAEVMNYEHVYLTETNYPETHKLLLETLKAVDTRECQYDVSFIVSHSKNILVHIVCGLQSPVIAISINAWLTLSLSEIRFAIRMCLSLMANYPIENTELRNVNLNHELIIAAVTDDLSFGISYCRKLIQLLSQERDKFKIGNYNPQNYYDLGLSIDFHTDLIKMIEMKLAESNKTVLQTAFFKSTETLLPEKVTNEMRDLLHQWIDDQSKKLKNHQTLEVLRDILNAIPNLRINNAAERIYPTTATRSMLTTIEQLRINTDDPVQVTLLTDMIDAAHKHRVASFSDLYIKICKKLFPNGELRPLSLYQRHVNELHAFIDAKSASEAETLAKELRDKLRSNDYILMFMNSAREDKGFRPVNDCETTSIDTYPTSNIGGRLDWSREVKPLSDVRLNQMIEWACSGRSPYTAYLLFRLGHVNIAQLWSHLPDESEFRSYFHNLVFFGKLPNGHSRLSYGDIAPILTNFIEPYLTFRYCSNFYPVNLPINKASLIAFITDNINSLALTEFHPQVSYELIHCFNVFLEQDRTAAEQFIAQFYCDKEFPAGIHHIKKHREAIGLSMWDKLPERLKKWNECNDLHPLHPYLAFIIQHAYRYIPITTLLPILCECFLIVRTNWPLSYFFTVLNLNVNKFRDVTTALTALNDLCLCFTNDDQKSFIEAAIAKTYKHAADNIYDINLFSTSFYTFYKEACKKSHGADIATVLLARQDIIEQIQCSQNIEMTTTQLTKLYISFDKQLSWPDEKLRNTFSDLLLQKIKNEPDEKQRIKALTILLFRTQPISDMALLNISIEMFSEQRARELGEDDNSFTYYRKAAIIILYILKSTPHLYTCRLLESLTTKIFAQSQLLEYISKSFAEDHSIISDFIEAHEQSYLVKIARRLSKNNCSEATVRFVTHELSRQSIREYVSHLNAENRAALGNRKDNNIISDQQAAIYAASFYHAFWNQSIEVRAVVINNLLMNSKKLRTEYSAITAYRNALDYIINDLFPYRDEESEICIALMHSYLEVSNTYVRPYLLAAILTANKMSASNKGNISATLPKIAEALGAAGVKAGQAGHSYPNTPTHIREGLAYLKSRARLPYRWELWQQIKNAVPIHFQTEIQSLRQLLGGASFYIAVEVRMKDGSNKVIRLLRPNAQQEANYGFEHLRQTLASCDHQLVTRISNDIGSIITEAKSGAQTEINHLCARRQYTLATAIYKNIHVPLKMADCVYQVTLEPVQLFSCGSQYQIISKADGIEFNTLKTMPEHLEICQAAATAVYLTELENMLSGRPCDFDRHGAQARIQWEATGQQEISIRVINYDFGEIHPDLPTEQQLYHCQQFINLLATNVFSTSHILSALYGSLDVSVITNEITQQMLQYLHAVESTCEPHDLIRMRGLFKGLLALNDYLEVIPKNMEFMLKLNALFAQYAETSSLASKVLGWYTGHTTLPEIELPPEPNYQAQALLQQFPGGGHHEEPAESESKKAKTDAEYNEDAPLSLRRSLITKRQSSF